MFLRKACFLYCDKINPIKDKINFSKMIYVGIGNINVNIQRDSKTSAFVDKNQSIVYHGNEYYFVISLYL